MNEDYRSLPSAASPRETLLKEIRRRIADTPEGCIFRVTAEELLTLNPRLTPAELAMLAAEYAPSGLQHSTHHSTSHPTREGHACPTEGEAIGPAPTDPREVPAENPARKTALARAHSPTASAVAPRCPFRSQLGGSMSSRLKLVGAILLALAGIVSLLLIAGCDALKAPPTYHGGTSLNETIHDTRPVYPVASAPTTQHAVTWELDAPASSAAWVAGLPASLGGVPATQPIGGGIAVGKVRYTDVTYFAPAFPLPAIATSERHTIATTQPSISGPGSTTAEVGAVGADGSQGKTTWAIVAPVASHPWIGVGVWICLFGASGAALLYFGKYWVGGILIAVAAFGLVLPSLSAQFIMVSVAVILVLLLLGVIYYGYKHGFQLSEVGDLAKHLIATGRATLTEVKAHFSDSTLADAGVPATATGVVNVPAPAVVGPASTSPATTQVAGGAK